MLSNSYRASKALFSLLTLTAVVAFIVFSAQSVIAEGAGGGMCLASVDGFYDFNEGEVLTNGVQTGISFQYTSPYVNNFGALMEVQWTAYNSAGQITAQFTSPWENANTANATWMIENYNSPSTWSWIDASVTYTASGMAQKYGHVKGYNMAAPGC